MLVPAVLYKDKIEDLSKKKMYDDYMFFDSGDVRPSSISVQRDQKDGNASRFEYAILDNDGMLVGWFRYYINWYNRQLYLAGLMNLTDTAKPVIGFDLYKEVERAICKYKIHRIEFRMIGGNPVQKSYDKVCAKLNGTRHVLKDVFKDRFGEYHDEYIYEVITEY